jgi:putative methionine-R-sulfoxide reductase with GAF domain
MTLEPRRKNLQERKQPRRKPKKRACNVDEHVKPKLYASLVVQLLSLLKGEHDFVANAANFSACFSIRCRM